MSALAHRAEGSLAAEKGSFSPTNQILYRDDDAGLISTSPNLNVLLQSHTLLWNDLSRSPTAPRVLHRKRNFLELRLLQLSDKVDPHCRVRPLPTKKWN
jgi:hypothetical protein